MPDETMNPAPPRILLVEDDPVSAAYLQALTEQVPADVDVAGSSAHARLLASRHAYALCMIDAHLPDGSGPGLLAALRDDGVAATALAHTAATDRGALDRLIEAGFVEVLPKPVDAALWIGTVRRWLGVGARHAVPSPGHRNCRKQPIWDDTAAVRALGGNREHVAALRRLFLDELPAQRDAIVSADLATMRDPLHRLSASCGFVGALRLQAAVAWLQADPCSHDAMAQFNGSIDDTLASRVQTPG